MKMLQKSIPAFLLACGLILTLVACTSGGAAEAPRAEVPSVLTQSAVLSGPAAQSRADGVLFSGGGPAAAPGDEAPSATGDVPALFPDEETQLTYTVNGEEITVSALRHHTLHGYSIAYDTEHYVCNSFVEGKNYWAGVGNYLSVSVIPGMPMEDVLAGLRLQENIAMEPETVSVGAESYSAQTLYLTTPSGLYRQFWAMDCAGDVLLVEQSYDTVSDDNALYRASQLAMLATLTISC